MALILVGQSELRDRLNLTTAPRPATTFAAIWRTPGRTRHLRRRAIDDIYQFSSGAARLINKVCTHALIYGAQNKHRIIDDHMVKRVIQGELL